MLYYERLKFIGEPKRDNYGKYSYLVYLRDYLLWSKRGRKRFHSF